jgi:transposase
MAYEIRTKHINREHESKLLQHLGIVGGMCNESRLAELIDSRIEQKRRKVSVGQAVQAMILNALGFTGRALYLTPRFYASRPVDVLVGENLQAADLHDSSLGTALDVIYEHGITELFYSVAQKILTRYGISTRFSHLDSTTFSLHGVYNSEEEEEEIEEKVIHITKGYSKDNAPELNQVVLQLICTHKSSIPLWIEALSGNSSDKKSFRETIKEFQKQFDGGSMPYMVMDSAFYTKENLAESGEFRWVTRVPETLKEVKEHYLKINRDAMLPLTEGYRYLAALSTYGGVEQRWLIIFSEQAYQREIKTFEKNLVKERDRNAKALKHLRNEAFACEADAEKAARQFIKKLRHQSFEYAVVSRNRYAAKGRPAKDAEPDTVEWYISGTLSDDEAAIAETKKRKGMFVVATNELDSAALSDEQLLEAYKDQAVTVERGFRFLKDPLFYAESLYLKSPQRIMALLMVMTLSLLMYSLAEMRIRSALKEKKRSIWDQKNKSTDRPTVRWVFMIFEDVLLLYTRKGQSIEKQAMNIREEHRIVLECLGRQFEKMYFLRK